MQNPVLGRELGLITRSWRVSLVLFMMVVLSGGMVLLYLAAASTGRVGAGLPSRAGVQLFSLLSSLQLGLIMLLAPGLTVGAISGERERRTLEPLLQTGISATSLLFGKLWAAVSYLLLLLVAITPAMGVLFLLGGAAPMQMLLVYAVLLATGVLQSTLGLFASALSRRTQTAASAAYVITAVLTLLSLLPTWVAGPALSTWGVKPQVFLVNAMTNPVTALAATTGGPLFSPILTTVLTPAAAPAAVQGSQSSASNLSGFLPPGYSAYGQSAGGAPVQPAIRGPVPKVTYGYLGFALAISLVMVFIAILAVRPNSGGGIGARLRGARKGGGADG